MKKFVCGDIHGAYKALIQVLNRANFDYKIDKITFLGDIVDGWSESKECLDLIMSITNKEVIMGNHDEWALYYYKGLEHYNFSDDKIYLNWRKHGGASTITSLGDIGQIDQKYIDFISSFKYYHEEDENLYVHAGISTMADDDDKMFPISKQHPYYLCWDRDFINNIYKNRKNITPLLPWKEIFLGHSPTIHYNDFYKAPQNWLNVWNMDTGAAFDGKLSLMDIDTKEIFQSDECRKLYPDERGRNEKSWNDTKSLS